MARLQTSVVLPPRSADVNVRVSCDSLLNGPSELVEVRYKVPFGLDVVPQKGLVVCTKGGEGGEQEGDVLRFSSYWSLRLPRGEGLAESAAAFSGGVRWQCGLFDVMKARAWEQVVEALTSNTRQRTDEVVLIFERALPSQE